MRHNRFRTMGLAAAGTTLALVAAGCTGGSGAAATILVDYSHDEFATQLIAYFPDRVQVHPGDTVAFRQAWTGAPHTVTMGTMVSEPLDTARSLFAEYGHLPEEEIPEEIFEQYFAAEEQLPLVSSFDDEENTEVDEDGYEVLIQAIAQPCTLADGQLPDDGSPCETQDLEPFDGTEAFYNSGIIPPDGPDGNRFDLVLADTIEPGEYSFYCAVHGAFQSGVIEVVPEGQPIPDPGEVSAQARNKVNELVQPFAAAYARARDEGQFEFAGETFTGNFSGLIHAEVDGLLNEFVPDVMEVGVDEPITWQMFGPHSVSFDVPEYFPIVEFADDGTVRYNLGTELPAGGAPDLPEDIDAVPGPAGFDPSEPLSIDGGTWDGSGFWSSGVVYADRSVEYTLRISTPGTYRYACLIHPPMVGEVIVTG